MNNPQIILLVGVPLSGKSTYIHSLENKDDFVILSTDDIIQTLADRHQSTYNAMWEKYIDWAWQEFNIQFKEALKAKKNIIIDQTNLTCKSRRRKLTQVPKCYTKVGIQFEIPSWEELYKRNEQRYGKHMSYKVLKGMIDIMQPISMFEDTFDHFWIQKIGN